MARSGADGGIVSTMRRVPPSLRALVLLPLLAVAVDQARATLACAPGAESCLEAAGGGWIGAAGLILLVLASGALAFGIARAAAGGGARGWLAGTLGVAALCGGQALLAGTTGDLAALGGGWLELLGFCAVAGAVLALALRVAPEAIRLVLASGPSAPRPDLALALAPAFPALPVRPASAPRSPATAGRAPPA
jgi:hypothetical protein